ncbi:purine-nucleoside phosphorylase [Microbacterium sp. Au-Mic1]|uniref:purine-nucleoside phosphorylase n=1 Tax=Microbacterium sp. Au-Mic1 TaxID=2906457 RepID=UPI001E467FFE|nr:purine-nucleoside phosphorylase [Microbacterium sp. Au-Mic1]MCE4025510.1 purine-nucleoside phosphorylase [Microbacterium sp. Au-Mic1]
MMTTTPNPLDLAQTDPFDIAREAAAQIAEATGVARHDIGLTLGTGWAEAADAMGETTATIEATDIVGFGKAAFGDHLGTVRSILLRSGKRALVVGARTHIYEGHGVRQVVHSVRTAAAAGATVMVLTNGSGGIPARWTPGTPVLISDQINLTAESPLEGATFIDLSDLYTPRLRQLARSVAPDLEEGVYCQFRGPHLETPAEVRMAETIGGHIVGMSTGLEAIAAREAGMEILGMSLIMNYAAGVQDAPLDMKEISDVGWASQAVLGPLLAQIVNSI